MRTITFHLTLLLFILFLSTSIIAKQQDSWTTFTTEHGLADNRVISIFVASDSTLWFGTDGGGVSHYANGSWTTFTMNEGLSNNIVNSICETEDKTLWFGTYNGISRYKDGIWTTFTMTGGLIDNRVNVIYEATDGAIWVGTYGGVGYYQNGIWNKFTTANGLVSNRVNTIKQSSDGAIWFGTDKGISHYKDAIWTTFTTSNGLADNTVNTIYESGDMVLWFGTKAGVSRFYDNFWTTFTEADGLVDNWINAICKSYDHALWFGTRAGVSKYKNGVWETLTEDNGLANNYVKSIILSIDGALWFGTYGGGVNRYQSSAPWINITYPNSAGIIWYCGDTHTIRWQSWGEVGPNVKLELCENNVPFKIINFNAINQGLYQTTISQDASSGENFKIKITSISNDSIYDFSDHPFAISPKVKVEEKLSILYSTKLYPNYPNPFNSNTKICYEILYPSEVQIRIYNIIGKSVKSLIHSYQSPGFYEVLWDGKDDQNLILSNGIYILEMKAIDFLERRKINLLK